jgi:hypothetical protein
MRGFISAAALALYGLGSAQNPVLLEDLRYAATDKTAWKIGPPKALATEARQGFVSPDGKWVIAALGPPMMDGRMPGSRLVLINALTGAQTSLGEVQSDELLADVVFSADNGLIALTIFSEALAEEGSLRVFMYSMAAAKFSQPTLFPVGSTLLAVGTGSVAAFIDAQGDASSNVQVFSVQANRWQDNELLSSYQKQGWRAIWGSDGVGQPMLTRGGELKSVDLATGQLIDWDESGYGESLALMFSATDKPGQASLWPQLRNEAKAVAVLSEDATWAQLSTNGSAAIYISDAVLFLRRVEQYDFALYRNVLKEEVKRQAISTAKQAGVAVQIYAADYDGILPGNRAIDALMPYVKNKALLDAVNWTNLGGQSLDRIANPTQTELGYVQTEFGTAVIMADGSVQWRDKPGG